MITRRTVLAAVAVLALPLSAHASEITPFSAGAFEQAQADGRPILVHVTAPWCGTCRAQKQVLPDLLGSPELRTSRKPKLKRSGRRAQAGGR